MERDLLLSLVKTDFNYCAYYTTRSLKKYCKESFLVSCTKKNLYIGDFKFLINWYYFDKVVLDLLIRMLDPLVLNEFWKENAVKFSSNINLTFSEMLDYKKVYLPYLQHACFFSGCISLGYICQGLFSVFSISDDFCLGHEELGEVYKFLWCKLSTLGVSDFDVYFEVLLGALKLDIFKRFFLHSKEIEYIPS